VGECPEPSNFPSETGDRKRAHAFEALIEDDGLRLRLQISNRLPASARHAEAIMDQMIVNQLMATVVGNISSAGNFARGTTSIAQAGANNRLSKSKARAP
jgi:hypothetical protein